MIRILKMPEKLGLLESLLGSTLAALGTGWVKCSNGVIWKLDLTKPTHRSIVYANDAGAIPGDWAQRTERWRFNAMEHVRR